MDQPGKVANPARGLVNRGKIDISLSPLAPENLASRDSRPASAHSFSTLRLNLVLAHGTPPAFRGGVHLSIPLTAIGSVQSYIRSRNCVPRWRSPDSARLSVCHHMYNSKSMDSMYGSTDWIGPDGRTCSCLARPYFSQRRTDSGLWVFLDFTILYYVQDLSGGPLRPLVTLPFSEIVTSFCLLVKTNTKKKIELYIVCPFQLTVGYSCTVPTGTFFPSPSGR